MKKLLLVLILLMLGLTAAAWWFSPSRRRSGEPTFSLASAEFGNLVETVSATGVLQPQEVIPVGTELAGKVVEVKADFNQPVKEGDLLLRLDDRAAQEKLKQAVTAVRLASIAVKQAEAQQEQAQAQKEGAQKTVDRLKALPENVSLRKDLDTAEAQLKAAVAQVDAAKAAVTLANEKVREAQEAQSLAKLGVQLTEVRVPVIVPLSASSQKNKPGLGSLAPDGTKPITKRQFIVLDRKVELNQQVGPPLSAQLFLLGGDLAQMQAIAQVAEGDIGRVRKGLKAEFTVSAYGEDTIFNDPENEVADIRPLPTSDHGAIFYRVVVNVKNRQDTAGDWQLRPGMTASVDIVIHRHNNVWKVPLSAVNYQLPDEYQNEAARARLKQWQARSDADQWKVVWVLGADRKPTPVFVRLSPKSGDDPGIRDSQFDEVLEWEPDMKPDPKNPPQFIIGAPPADKGGLFHLPPVKL